MRTSCSCKFVLILMLLTGFAYAQQETSLGELAKRKGTKKAKIVIGDDDVAHSTANPLAEVSADPDKDSAAAPSSGPDVAGTSHAAAGASQKGGDPKTAELRNKVEKLTAEEDMYKTSLKTGQERLQKATTDYERDVAQETIENNTHNVQVASDKKKQAEAELKALQDSKKK